MSSCARAAVALKTSCPLDSKAIRAARLASASLRLTFSLDSSSWPKRTGVPNGDGVHRKAMA